MGMIKRMTENKEGRMILLMIVGALIVFAAVCMIKCICRKKKKMPSMCEEC